MSLFLELLIVDIDDLRRSGLLLDDERIIVLGLIALLRLEPELMSNELKTAAPKLIDIVTYQMTVSESI